MSEDILINITPQTGAGFRVGHDALRARRALASACRVSEAARWSSPH
jgi:hypothetical protein